MAPHLCFRLRKAWGAILAFFLLSGISLAVPDPDIPSEQIDNEIASVERALSKDLDGREKSELLFRLSSLYLQKGVIPYMVNREDRFYQKALMYAEQCLGLTPHHWQAIWNKAMIYAQMRKPDQADSLYKESEKWADPNSSEFQQLLIQHEMLREIIRIRDRRREEAAQHTGT